MFARVATSLKREAWKDVKLWVDNLNKSKKFKLFINQQFKASYKLAFSSGRRGTALAVDEVSKKQRMNIMRRLIIKLIFILSLFLLAQEAQKKKLRKKKSAVFLCRFLKKAPQKLSLLALCKMYKVPDRFV